MYTLKIARAMRSITQVQLARKTGLNQGRISMAENYWLRFREDEKTRIEEALGMVGMIDWNTSFSSQAKEAEHFLKNRSS